MYFMSLTLDVSKLLSGWLNAYAIYGVARGGAWGGGRHAGPGAGGRAWGGVAVAQAACREGASCGGSLPGGARAERTLNMNVMVVTLDVSQLDMSALNCPKSLKR